MYLAAAIDDCGVRIAVSETSADVHLRGSADGVDALRRRVKQRSRSQDRSGSEAIDLMIRAFGEAQGCELLDDQLGRADGTTELAGPPAALESESDCRVEPGQLGLGGLADDLVEQTYAGVDQVVREVVRSIVNRVVFLTGTEQHHATRETFAEQVSSRGRPQSPD